MKMEKVKSGRRAEKREVRWIDVSPEGKIVVNWILISALFKAFKFSLFVFLRIILFAVIYYNLSNIFLSFPTN